MSNVNLINVLSVKVLLILQLLSPVTISTTDSEVYYITPHLNTSCSESDDHLPCLTLTQYVSECAINNCSYANVNTTLVLLHGNHTIDSVFLVKNATRFSMIAMGTVTLNDTGTRVICGNNAWLGFDRSEHITINGLEFMNCVNTIVSLVDMFDVGYSIFQNQGIEKSTLSIISVSHVTIFKSIFSFTNDPSLDFRSIVQGGAIAISNSSVSIEDCLFEGNMAARGGAIYCINSNLTIWMSVFEMNIVTGVYDGYGGAIFTGSSVLLTVYDSKFINNAVIQSYYGLGGAIYLTNVNSFKARNVTFFNNSVSAVYPTAGVLFIYSSSVSINVSSFVNNTIISSSFDNQLTQIRGGGALFSTFSYVKLVNVLFQDNAVLVNGYGGGGVMAISFNIMLQISNSTFVNNSVLAFNGYGGVLYTQSSGAISLNNCTMIENSVIAVNGTGFGGVIQSFSSYSALNNCNLSRNFVSAANGGGGAINMLQFSYMNLSSCVLANNFATVSHTTGIGVGGVTYTASSSVIEFNNSSLTNNKVFGDKQLGGAVYADSSAIVARNSTFAQNSVTGGGGAVYGYNTTLIMNSTTFSINTVIISGVPTDGSGGAMFLEHCNASLLSNTFIGNNVTNSNFGNSTGAALFSNFSVIVLHMNRFYRNSIVANTYGGGGALCAYFSIIELHSCLFVGNHVIAMRGYGGAICIANGTNSTITASHFLNNSIVASFVGTGGALDIEHSTINATDVLFEMNDVACNFNGYGGATSSLSSTGNFDNCVFNRNTVTAKNYARGGGLYVEFQMTNLIDNSFTNNLASGNRNGYGGAIFLWSTSVTTTGNITIHSNIANTSVVYTLGSVLLFNGHMNISNNIGSIYAFSTDIKFKGYTSVHSNSPSMSNTIPDSISEGGGLTLFQGNVTFLDTTLIAYNTAKNGGGIRAVESKVYIHGDVTITNNMVSESGGGLYISQSELNINKNTLIMSNVASHSGGGIHAVGSSINYQKGSLKFLSNSAHQGGAISLDLNAKLYIVKTEPEFLLKNTTQFVSNHLIMEFINNTANFGGALYVTDTHSKTCASALSAANGSECFFQVLALYTPDIDTQNIEGIYLLNVNNTQFSNNEANVSGGVIYGGLLDRCVVSPFAEVYNVNSTIQSPTTFFVTVSNIKIQDFHDKSTISSDPVRVCFCISDQPDCTDYNFPAVKVKKGETFSVLIAAVDQVNNSVPATIQGSLFSHDSGLSEGETSQSIGDRCTALNYTAFSPHNSEQLLLYAIGPCNNTGKSQAQITIQFEPCTCPTGFKIQFNQTNCTCTCDPHLKSYVTSCFANNNTLLKVKGTWISYANITDGTETFLLNSHCPFDYCSRLKKDWYIDLNQPNGADIQCTYNRTGKLCGQCEEHLSLTLGSSRCMSCSNNWLSLLLAFALAGLVLVAFLLVFNLTVAIGTFNGLILYANIISAHRTVYYPSSEQNVLTIFIAWLNLDLGFETCFFDGMDSYAKVWLQLAFPCYIILLVITVVAISKCSNKFARLISKRNPAATLATLTLLSYTKLIRTIIAAMSLSKLRYMDRAGFETVWQVDGNVVYLKGKHIPLFITALMIAVIGIAYTGLLVLWQWLQRLSHKKCLSWIGSTRLYPFIDACHAPFAPKHRYWFGLLLLLRVFLYLLSVIASDPKINLLAILITVGTLLLVINPLGKGIVYNKWSLNCLESSFLYNLMIFTLSTLYLQDANQVTNYTQSALYETSTSIAMVTFLLVVVYHTLEFVFKTSIPTVLKNKIFARFHTQRTDNHEEPYPAQGKTHNTKNREHSTICSYTEIDVSRLHTAYGMSPGQPVELQHQPLSNESTLTDENTEANVSEQVSTVTTGTSGYASSDYNPLKAMDLDTCITNDTNSNEDSGTTKYGGKVIGLPVIVADLANDDADDEPLSLNESERTALLM